MDLSKLKNQARAQEIINALKTVNADLFDAADLFMAVRLHDQLDGGDWVEVEDPKTVVTEGLAGVIEEDLQFDIESCWNRWIDEGKVWSS